MGRKAKSVAVVGLTAAAAAAAAATTAAIRAAQSLPESLPARRDGHRTTIRSVTINRPPDEVYHFWRDLPRLAAALPRPARVEEFDERRSRWSISGPAGATIDYTAEIIGAEPGKLLAWRVTDGPVPHEGHVEFAPAPGERGTEVLVELRYEMPASTVGAAVAKLTGDEPDQVLRGSLRRVKQVLECGEMITVHGQPTGRGPGQEKITRLLQDKLATGGRP